jgi:predicted PurR-regulated permease PerM
MGRGLGMPMLVMLVGAIRCVLSNGILGFFLGPVVLAAGYKLFIIWLNDETLPPEILSGDGPQIPSGEPPIA